MEQVSFQSSVVVEEYRMKNLYVNCVYFHQLEVGPVESKIHLMSDGLAL